MSQGHPSARLVCALARFGGALIRRLSCGLVCALTRRLSLGPSRAQGHPQARLIGALARFVGVLLRRLSCALGRAALGLTVARRGRLGECIIAVLLSIVFISSWQASGVTLWGFSIARTILVVTGWAPLAMVSCAFTASLTFTETPEANLEIPT